jgi:hypothetical protein
VFVVDPTGTDDLARCESRTLAVFQSGSGFFAPSNGNERANTSTSLIIENRVESHVEIRGDNIICEAASLGSVNAEVRWVSTIAQVLDRVGTAQMRGAH